MYNTYNRSECGFCKQHPSWNEYNCDSKRIAGREFGNKNKFSQLSWDSSEAWKRSRNTGAGVGTRARVQQAFFSCSNTVTCQYSWQSTFQYVIDHPDGKQSNPPSPGRETQARLKSSNSKARGAKGLDSGTEEFGGPRWPWIVCRLTRRGSFWKVSSPGWGVFEGS